MFFRKVGFLLLVLVLLIFATGMLVARLVWGTELIDHKPDAAPSSHEFAVGFLLLVVIGGVVLHSMRRTALPIGDVMDAADRLARGDYSARVKTCGPREARNLGLSFNEMAQRLQANEEQRRMLLADIAHELRTPLSVVRGNVEGMLDGVYPLDAQHLEPLLEETAIMARLLDDLRTLSLAETGMLRLYPESIDIGELIYDVTTTFRPTCAEAGITIEGAVSEMPELEIDPVRIRQVLENLLTNAMRYTPPGGTIRMQARVEGEQLVLTVSDTGAGIAPDDLPYIFDRFAKSADSGGSGLGLAIAKRLVEAHGGVIEAVSTVGEGTTMTIWLDVMHNAPRTIHVHHSRSNAD
jgi:signal transduction histidine kinase